MEVVPLFPETSVLRVEQVLVRNEVICISARTDSPTATCPLCGQASKRVHSRYLRRLADLPRQGRRVRLDLRVRRFFCGGDACPQRIFAERLAQVAAAHARKTERLVAVLQQVGLACGGEGGARLLRRWGMPASADTLLRVTCQISVPAFSTPRVLGVDDWALRKGQRYGTILCDLERHRPLALLPGRSADVLSAWLCAHPGVEIISRDRAGDYARGAAAGAPKAVQVADRWHLIRNAHDALVRVAERHHRAWENLRLEPAPPPKAIQTSSNGPPIIMPKAEPTRLSASVERQQQRRQRRLRQHQQILNLAEAGRSQRRIAQELQIDRETVRRHLRAGSFPERAKTRRHRSLDPFEAVLQERWAQGCRNSAQLARELKSEGYEGSSFAVYRWTVAQRTTPDAGPTKPPAPGRTQRLSPKQAAWLLLREERELREPERQWRLQLQQQCPEAADAAALLREFAGMVRERQSDRFDGWLAKVAAQPAGQELKGFVAGLRRDLDAVRAALKLPWSNGPVEGHISRLKMLKRQMYGRGSFALLSRRFLCAA